MKSIKLIVAIVAAWFLVLPALAGHQGGQGNGNPEQLLEHMAEVLNLSEDQKQQVQPILNASAAERRAVMEKYGVGPGKERPDRKTLQAMRPEMKAIRKDTDEQLSAVLSAEQMEQVQTMREEARARMREHAKEQRQQQSQ